MTRSDDESRRRNAIPANASFVAPSSLENQCHHYALLIQRWRALARQTGIRIREFARADDARGFYVSTRALGTENGIYISAGIHGDEPAGVVALLRWAEQNAARLNTIPLMMFPCLNPWGLVNNARRDASGNDLNRLFHLETSPVIAALKRLLLPFQFSSALMLHEDFDGQGLSGASDIRRPSGCTCTIRAGRSRSRRRRSLRSNAGSLRKWR